MSVLFTLALLGVLAMWGIAVYSRLLRLRGRIKTVSKQAGAKGDDADGARRAYHDLATTYNSAIRAFPGNIVAGLAGFQLARKLDVKSSEQPPNS